MKNKGFTMLELIAVILILGAITLITVPTVNKIIEKSKKDLLNEQIKRIEKTAQTYMVEAMEIDPENPNASYLIKISDMKKKGFLSSDDIINPVTEDTMNGCVIAEYNNHSDKYKYVYLEDCPYKNEYSNADKLIITYENDDFTESSLLDSATQNEIEEYDLDENSIKYTYNSTYTAGVFYNENNFIEAFSMNITKTNDYKSFKYIYDKISNQAYIQNKTVFYNLNKYMVYVLDDEVPEAMLGETVTLTMEQYLQVFSSFSPEYPQKASLDIIDIDN